ncbi:hypothetical protein AB4P91_23870 [Pseudomonas sp. B21128]|uniref:hypothetical protein n=1 Tax=Pseudomonas TaxID=286 RepID=UPI001242E1B6|nr:hypothetical protein [Pseudomonas fluorescens]
MTKTSKTEMTKKDRDLMSPEGKRPDGNKAQRALGADLTAILEKVLRQAKKSPLGRRAGELLSNGWLHLNPDYVKSL